MPKLRKRKVGEETQPLISPAKSVELRERAPLNPPASKPLKSYTRKYKGQTRDRLITASSRRQASLRRQDVGTKEVAPPDICNEELTAQNVDNTITEVIDNINADITLDDMESGHHELSGENHGERESDNDEQCDDTSTESEGMADDGWRLVRPVEGGPVDISILTSYRGHVAYEIWKNNERDVLQGQTRFKVLTSWNLSNDDQWVSKVKDTNLDHLSACIFKHLNMSLISAFVERWHPETNSFHMPFGEMSITLHDVAYLLDLKIDGCSVTNKITDIDTMKKSISKCLRIPLSTLKIPSEMKGCAIKLETIQIVSQKLEDASKAKAYLFSLLGGVLFLDKTFDKANGFIMPLLEDLEHVSDYAWGTATLANLYRQLGIASRAGTRGIGGCLVLLEAWIYEYFPNLAPRINSKYKENMPRACKWISKRPPEKGISEVQMYRGRIDFMKASEVAWTPFHQTPHIVHPVSLYEGVIQFLDVMESYMPQRFIRQYGFVQDIPQDPLIPEEFSRPQKSVLYVVKHPLKLSLFMWSKRPSFPDTTKFNAASNPFETTNDYLRWFSRISHVRVQNPEHCNSLPIASREAFLPSQHEKMDRLRELLGSVHVDKRPTNGFDDRSVYHFVIDECNKVLSDQ